MGGRVRGIGVDGLPAFDQSDLLEAQIVSGTVAIGSSPMKNSVPRTPAVVNGVCTSRARGPRLRKCVAPLSRFTTPVRWSFTGSTVSSVFEFNRSTD
jgi:hypothetical protein